MLRREGSNPDDFYLSKEDIIGADPSSAIHSCDAWTQLQQLTGLECVKKSVKDMIDRIETNYKRELKELARVMYLSID